METYLGLISRGWAEKNKKYGIQVVLFEQNPAEDLSTYCTLGLDKFVLDIGDGKKIRQELIFSTYKTYPPDEVASFLMTFAESVADSGKGLLRGEVIEGKPLIDGVEVTGMYASVPVFWPDELHEFEGSSPTTIFVWLLPILKSEAEVIREEGWNYFEHYLEEHSEADLWDLDRDAIPLR
ncbi:suppressor of fused domain protein [Hymenobacter edaphi]|nr:suppressor of fused domain protein [Hymenobacter edaphi]